MSAARAASAWARPARLGTSARQAYYEERAIPMNWYNRFTPQALLWSQASWKRFSSSSPPRNTGRLVQDLPLGGQLGRLVP